MSVSREEPTLKDFKCNLEVNFVKDHKEMGVDGVDWIHLAQDRERSVVGSCEHDNGSLGSVEAGKFVSFPVKGSDS
jgi:hypothetical protein